MIKIVQLAILMLTCQGLINAQTLLTINNEPVSVAEFKKIYQKNNISKNSFSRKEITDYLNLFTLYKMKLAEAKAKKLDTAFSLKDDYRKYSDQLALSYFTNKNYIDSVIKIQYDRSKKDIQVAHIMLKCDPNASPADTLAIYNKLTLLSKSLTPSNFKEMASQHSQDENTKNKGGELGFITTFMTFPEFEDIVYTTPKGAISSIFKTQFGYHILYVMDIRPAMGKIKVAHIYINDKTEEEKKQHLAEKKINDAYKDLSVKKEKFEDVVLKYSQDESSKKNKGEIKPFGISEMIAPFEAQSFALTQKYQYSKPFQSEYGWHIVQLIEKIPVPPYEELKPYIKQRIEKDPRYQDAQYLSIQKIKSTYHWKESKQNLTLLNEKLDSNTFLSIPWKMKEFNLGNTELFSLDQKSYKVHDFVQYANTTFAQTVAKNKREMLSSLYQNYSDKTLMDVAKAHLSAENQDYKNLLEEYQNGLLIFDIMDREIWQKANKDTNGLKAYYDKIKENYMYNERANVAIFTTKDKKIQAEIVQNLSKSTSNADAYYAKIKQSKDSNAVNFIRKTIEKGENGTIDIKPWVVGATESILNTDKDQYQIYIFEQLIPPSIKPLNEVKGRIQNLYQSKIEKDWNDYLRNKYTVKINQSELDSIVK